MTPLDLASAQLRSTRAAVYARIVEIYVAEPTLSSAVISQRTGISHVTVRKVLRAAGVYRDMRVATNKGARNGVGATVGNRESTSVGVPEVHEGSEGGSK